LVFPNSLATAEQEIQPEPQPQSVEEKIEQAFGEHADVMKRIALCESGMKQHWDNGEPIISPTRDGGIFQINFSAHLETTKKMGLDVINSEDDNIAYAKYLFEQSGTQPWYMSRKCHGY
jgi:hypothetical protein